MNLAAKHPLSPAPRLSLLLVVVVLAAVPLPSTADDATNSVPAKAEKPPPLPLHQIEGNGGSFSTLSAYIVDPARDGEPVGSLRYGVVQIVVHDAHVTQIEKTERVRLDNLGLTATQAHQPAARATIINA